MAPRTFSVVLISPTQAELQGANLNQSPAQNMPLVQRPWVSLRARGGPRTEDLDETPDHP